MENSGLGTTGKSKEEIFRTCLMKALSTVCVDPYHYNALEFYEAINLAKHSYAMELQILKQEIASLNVPFVNLEAFEL